MQGSTSPVALPVNVDTTGAKIMDSLASRPQQNDSRDIYLPNHVEAVSHIAVDIGGSLAKVVYFTRSAHAAAKVNHDGTETNDAGIPFISPPGSKLGGGGVGGASGDAGPSTPPSNTFGGHSRESSAFGSRSPLPYPYAHQTADGGAAVPAGTLTPTSLFPHSSSLSASALQSHFLKRRSLPTQLPGGRLNFIKFETANIASCLAFLKELIDSSAQANSVSLEQMRKRVKVMATGGGAHLFFDLFETELGVEVHKEDEMGCLITGLNFITLIPDEVFWYSDELVSSLAQALPTHMTDRRDPSSMTSSSPSSSLTAPLRDTGTTTQPKLDDPPPLPRPSPDPPLYAPLFDSNPSPKLPCLLVNIGSGVSIIRVDDYGKFERVSGTSLGGGTLWGLLSLLTDADSFDEMLDMATQGDNSAVDMLVADVYGATDALSSVGLKSNTIASSFGKVFRKDKGGEQEGEDGGPGRQRRQKKFRQEDICKSLLYAVSNNIGQIAYMNAEKFNLDRIYFSGCFIRGHRATIATLSYAIRFWSKGSKRAFFLRHEGYLGAVGAWIKQVSNDDGEGSHNFGGSRTATSVQPATSAALIEKINEHHRTRSLSSKPENMPTPVVELQEPRIGESRSDTPVNGINGTTRQPSSSDEANHSLPPMLAEALGGVSLDGVSSVNGVSHHANGQLEDLIVDDQDFPEEAAEDEEADTAALLESLSTEDRALLEPMLFGPRDSNQGAKMSVAQLLAKMDAASGAADGLEDKLDDLLSKLDGMLVEGEEQGTAP